MNTFLARFWVALASVLLIGLTLGPAHAQGYGVRAGDTLKVEVLEDPSLNRLVLVAPDGRITVPGAGTIQASGRTVDQISANLATALAPSFATTPTVYVSLERQAERRASSGGGVAKAPTIAVYVMGEAAKPGKLEVAPGTTVLQLFAEMGGFSKFAAVKRIQLRRGDQTFALNYEAIEAGLSDAGATTIKAGDVLIIPQRKLFE
jgi:polysaccharide export outer membrane protein